MSHLPPRRVSQVLFDARRKNLRGILLLLFNFSVASFAFGQTKVPSTLIESKSPLLETNEWGGVQSVRLFLQASSNGPMRFSYGGEPHLNRTTLLLSYLEDEKIADELELTAKQQESVSGLIKEYSELSKELYAKIEANEGSRESLKEWIQDKGKHFEKELDRVLLPHQVDVLAKIQVNYMVAAFGFSQVARFAKQSGLSNIPSNKVVSIARRERELAPQLRHRCDEFSRTQLKRILDVLDENQKQLFESMVAKTRFTTYPELITAQAELATNGKEKLDLQIADDLGEWGLAVAWALSYSGTLKPRFQKLNGYELDYLVNALAKDQRMIDEIGILDYQLESIESICGRIQILNQELGEQIQGNSRNSDKLIDDWKQEKRRYVVRELHQVLLPFQETALNDETQLIRLRKLGIISYLTNESTVSTLELSNSQVAKLKKIANKIPDEYLDFSKKTVNWAVAQVLQDFEDGTQEKDDLIELFDSSYRVVSMPVGCLAETLARRHGK